MKHGLLFLGLMYPTLRDRVPPSSTKAATARHQEDGGKWPELGCVICVYCVTLLAPERSTSMEIAIATQVLDEGMYIFKF